MAFDIYILQLIFSLLFTGLSILVILIIVTNYLRKGLYDHEYHGYRHVISFCIGIFCMCFGNLLGVISRLPNQIFGSLALQLYWFLSILGVVIILATFISFVTLIYNLGMSGGIVIIIGSLITLVPTALVLINEVAPTQNIYALSEGGAFVIFLIMGILLLISVTVSLLLGLIGRGSTDVKIIIIGYYLAVAVWIIASIPIYPITL